jgi:hypothetical protein
VKWCLSLTFRMIVVLPLLIMVSSPKADPTRSTVAAWIDSLHFDGRVADAVGLYAKEKGGVFSEGYTDRLFAGVRRAIGADVERRLAELSGGARPSFVEVTILEPGFADVIGDHPGNDTEREFEKSFIRTEVLAFFPDEDTAPDEALDLYTRPEFRKVVSSRIKRIWEEGEEVCVEFSGVKLLLDPLMYCDRIDDLHATGLSAQHTQAVRNPGGDKYQTMFFKESLKTFVSLPDGLAFHYINYSRTIGMGALQRKIARGKIEDSEKRAVEELARRLAARAEAAGE